MDELVEIDGSYLEGGGQIVRTALALSCIMKRPVRIINIRANRPNPGLSNQHLFGLNLLQKLTSARVKGNEIKSTSVEFHPDEIRWGSFTIDTLTAASVTLIFQAVLPVLLFGSCNSGLELIGGTNVGMAPQVEFTTEILLPNLEPFGITYTFDVLRRGYFPRGGGRVYINVAPVSSLRGIDITKFGRVTEVCGWCYVAGNYPIQWAREMKYQCDNILKDLMPEGSEIEAYKELPAMAKYNGAGLILKCTTNEGCAVGADALADRNVDAPSLGKEAASQLEYLLEKKICIDSHVQDQLIIFMALARGESRILTCPLTNHTRTAIHVTEIMTGVKFKIEEIDPDHIIISCDGIGKKNNRIVNKN